MKKSIDIILSGDVDLVRVFRQFLGQLAVKEPVIKYEESYRYQYVDTKTLQPSEVTVRMEVAK